MTEIEVYQRRTGNQLNAEISTTNIKLLLEKCFTYGPYQRQLFILLFSLKFGIDSPSMSLIFISANVPFLCYPPDFNASTIPTNLTENQYLHMFQPGPNQCFVYNNSITEIYYSMSPSNLSTLPCSYGRKFMTDNFSSTVSEFDLVCERKWLRSTLQSVYFAGYLIGSLVFGDLADRFGRKPIFLLTSSCVAIFGTGKIFIPSLTIFMVLHCIHAAANIGISLTLYSLILEFSSSSIRTPVNFVFMTVFTIASMVLVAIAYAIPDWHYLELTVCILPIINLFFWKCIPESPRWLIGRKHFREAQLILKKIMKKNKIDHEEVFDIFTNNEEISLENNFQQNIDEKKISKKERNYSFIDLFRTFRLAMITLNICFSWMVMSMLYYGTTINAVDMAGNQYINFLLMVAVEIPCFLCSYFLFICFDHRKPISFFMIFSGLNCIISNFVPKGSYWFPLILVILGKFGISAAFGSIYLLTAEIFPTVVRTNGLGISSMCARIGGIFAPFILQLSFYVSWLPLSIYGLLSVISGLLLLLLPETKDKDLPQKLEDLNRI